MASPHDVVRTNWSRPEVTHTEEWHHSPKEGKTDTYDADNLSQEDQGKSRYMWAQRYKHNNLAWMARRRDKQVQREADNQFNFMYDCATKSMRDLGLINNTWAMVFHLGRVDDYGVIETPHNPAVEQDPATRIPLEVYQLLHRMWKYDFHIDFSLSTSGEYLIVMVGLSYRILIEEAQAAKVAMRLKLTKGSVGFTEELIQRYPAPAMWNGTPFSSANQQMLVISRMKRKANIYPQRMLLVVAMESTLAPIRTMFTRGFKIRGHSLYKMFKAFGVYRPHGEQIFGQAVSDLSKLVLEDKWIVFEKGQDQQSLIKTATEFTSGREINYESIGEAIAVMEEWLACEGAEEQFTGTFYQFFALHDKQRLQHLKETWGNYRIIWQGSVYAKLPEEMSEYSFFHPQNKEVKQVPYHLHVDDVDCWISFGPYFGTMLN